MIALQLKPESVEAYEALYAAKAAAASPVDPDSVRAIADAHEFLAKVRAVHRRGTAVSTAEAAKAAGVRAEIAGERATLLKRRGLWPYLDPDSKWRKP